MPFSLTLLFLLINIIYVTLAGNFFEMGENNRFRFVIDPFVLIILGLFIHNGLLKIKQKYSDGTSSSRHTVTKHPKKHKKK